VSVEDTIRALDEERERIWLECPDEVRDMGRGIMPRRTGSHGQYLSTLIFAEGEARTLSDEMLWGMLQVMGRGGADLETLQALIAEIVAYKADFFDFVGMPQAGALVHRYVAAAQECTSIEELERLSSAAITYVNRLHMWVDAVFPWGVTNGFKRPEPAPAAAA
jgi:Cucumopine synthase C-terminal helical bundle domain